MGRGQAAARARARGPGGAAVPLPAGHGLTRETGAMSHRELTPRQSVEQECGQRGTAQLLAGCVELLAGGDADYSLIYALGGPAADSVLGPHQRREQRYFRRVWAARALLYAWDD